MHSKNYQDHFFKKAKSLGYRSRSALKLIELNKNSIVLNWKQREPKKIGKGKVTVKKSVDIDFMDITEAKVKVKI